jgi:hypothetical protein
MGFDHAVPSEPVLPAVAVPVGSTPVTAGTAAGSEQPDLFAWLQGKGLSELYAPLVAHRVSLDLLWRLSDSDLDSLLADQPWGLRHQLKQVGAVHSGRAPGRLLVARAPPSEPPPPRVPPCQALPMTVDRAKPAHAPVAAPAPAPVVMAMPSIVINNTNSSNNTNTNTNSVGGSDGASLPPLHPSNVSFVKTALLRLTLGLRPEARPSLAESAFKRDLADASQRPHVAHLLERTLRAVQQDALTGEWTVGLQVRGGTDPTGAITDD